MDDQLRRRIDQVVEELAVEQRERLAEAGTFVSLELLTAEIGDQIARKLSSRELLRRADEVSRIPQHGCPGCGRNCPLEPDSEPLILQGYRGEVEYREPRCHCPRCRRDFFPSGAAVGTRSACAGHAVDPAKSGLDGDDVAKL
jgi:transposase